MNLNQLFENTQGVNEGEGVIPDPKYDHEPPAQESDPIPDDQESDPIPDDADDEQGVAEESLENKYSNLSNRGVNRGINRAGDDFNRMLDLDQAESPHYKTQHQQDTKQRLKTKPMAGPKGVLPEQGVAEGQGRDKHYYLRNDIWRVMDGDELVHEYKPERYEVVGAKKLLARFDDEGYDVTHVISPMGTVTYLYGKPEMDEGFDGEYDDEAGMAHSNLHTIARAAEGLLNTIDDQENLPEWVQEKIAKVEGMMVSAWDYLKSQEEQGIDPRQDLDEIGDTPKGREKLEKYMDKANLQVSQHWADVHNKSHLPTDKKMAKRNAGSVAASNRLGGFGIQPSARSRAEKEVAEIIDYDTLNQLGSHPMAAPLAAAGGAAIGGAIGGGIKKTVDYFQKKKEQKAQARRSQQQGVAEGEEHSPVAGAITRRIMSQRLDLLKKYGPANVAAAIDDVAEFVGDAEEIGSSDVSGWVLQVERALGRMGQGLGEAGRNYHANTTGFARGARDPEGQDSAPDTRTWYIRLNGKLIKDKQGMPYSFRGKAAANKAAVNMQAKLFNKGKEFVLTTNPNDPQQGVAEQKKNSKASAITEGSLGDQSLAALMQARQDLQQKRAAELAAWEQDFRKNTAPKFAATQSAPPAPVAQPGQGHSELRAQLNMLDTVIKKQQQLDALGVQAKKLELLNEPDVVDDLNTSMYVRDAIRNNRYDYAALNKRLDTVIPRVSNRITQRQAAWKKPRAVSEDAGPVEAWGYAYNRRDQRVMWRKTFTGEAAAQAWADQHNATILGMRPVQQGVAEAGSPAQQAAIAIAMKKAGKTPKSKALDEFAPPGGGGGDSGRWYTDDELADIIGDDWFEDFDVSHDEFNIDAYGEKAKQNLASYANSWFDDKGYNVNVMGVEHNDVDHDLKWYIEGSFHNPRFAEQGVAEAQHSCPHCGGEMVSEELMNEKQDACYYKVKSRYKVWPSAYASGALVQCRKKGAKNWGNKSESAIGQAVDQVDENLRDWFGKDKWVRFGPDGKIRGDCARGDDSEGKPKCLPRSKANALGKKGRASAASRKRRQDPDAERSGPAINVNTKKKSNEDMTNGSDKKEATFRIQKMLNKKFGANLDVDGIMGPLTLQSINKFMPDAAAGVADQPNRTTAVQGKKLKEESRGRRVTRSGPNETAVKEQN